MKKVQMIVVFYVRKAGDNNKKVHTMLTYSVQGGFMNWGPTCKEYGIWDQPRSQGSPLPTLSCSVGRVGENPGNEVDEIRERFTLSLCMPYSPFLFAFLMSHAPATEAMPNLI